jgi:hypothetical protein
MGIFKIVSIVKDKFTKNPIQFRHEYIDTAKNYLYKDVESKAKVKSIYESIWNTNPFRATDLSVLRAERSNVISKGREWGLKVYKLKEVI